MKELVSATEAPPSVDRPDVAKAESITKLRFDSVKACLFKFLMQSGIDFTEPQKLNLSNTFYSKITGDEVTLNSAAFYTVNCKLEGITIDDRPVYIIILPEEYLNLENRVKNKIIQLKQQHKVIVFDKADWLGLGLEIEDKEYIKPLGKAILKSWARLLFKKMVEIGKVKADFNLNDLFEKIEFNTSSQVSTQTVISSLKKENQQLKYTLIFKNIEKYFTINKNTELVIDDISTLSQPSVLWIEEIGNEVLNFIQSLDLKKTEYRDIFRNTQGKILLDDKEKITQYLCKSFKNLRPHIKVDCIGSGLIQFQNNKTLQKVVFCISCTKLKDVYQLKIDKDTLKKIESSLFFHLSLHFGAINNKIDKIKVEGLILSNYIKPFIYDKSVRLPLYDSDRTENFSLYHNLGA